MEVSAMAMSLAEFMGRVTGSYHIRNPITGDNSYSTNLCERPPQILLWHNKWNLNCVQEGLVNIMNDRMDSVRVTIECNRLTLI